MRLHTLQADSLYLELKKKKAVEMRQRRSDTLTLTLSAEVNTNPTRRNASDRTAITSLKDLVEKEKKSFSQSFFSKKKK